MAYPQFENDSLNQVFKFAVVGLANNAFFYLLYLLITYLGSEPKLTMSVLYLVGLLSSFFLNRNWSFQHTGTVRKSLPRFLVAHLLGYIINYSMLAYFYDHLGVGHQWVQLAAVFVVGGFLFIVSKRLVFTSGYPGANPLDEKS